MTTGAPDTWSDVAGPTRRGHVWFAVLRLLAAILQLNCLLYLVSLAKLCFTLIYAPNKWPWMSGRMVDVAFLCWCCCFMMLCPGTAEQFKNVVSSLGAPTCLDSASDLLIECGILCRSYLGIQEVDMNCMNEMICLFHNTLRMQTYASCSVSSRRRTSDGIPFFVHWFVPKPNWLKFSA